MNKKTKKVLYNVGYFEHNSQMLKCFGGFIFTVSENWSKEGVPTLLQVEIVPLQRNGHEKKIVSAIKIADTMDITEKDILSAEMMCLKESTSSPRYVQASFEAFLEVLED